MQIAMSYDPSPVYRASQLPRKRLVARERPRGRPHQWKKKQNTPTKQTRLQPGSVLSSGNSRKRKMNACESSRQSRQPSCSNATESDRSSSSSIVEIIKGSKDFELTTNHEEPTRVKQHIGNEAFVYDLFPRAPGTKITLTELNGRNEILLSVEKRPLKLDDMRDLISDGPTTENARKPIQVSSEESMSSELEIAGISKRVRKCNHLLFCPPGNVVGVELVAGERVFGAKWKLRAAEEVTSTQQSCDWN
mmetsp:Transcript_34783/g.67288  ORF Transcript_34783/g.67288 Transcript_34783/m.67288 type:complete len:249 (+) Transcript_34783:24-770(+)